MLKFTKGLGIVALALVINLGAAQARGGHGGGAPAQVGSGHGGGGHYGGGHYGGGYGGGWHGRGYRGGYYGGGWGWDGFAAGAILGGLLAAPYYYRGGPYYYGPPTGDAVAYCLRRFRSYDPRSGTYLGYDGYRHPCP